MPHPGIAQRQDELTIAVGECLETEDDVERFACYERLVEEARAVESDTPDDAVQSETPKGPTALGTTTESAAATVAETARREPTTPAGARASEDTFGFPEETAKPERELPPEIRSFVTAVEEWSPNLLTVTLENGQIWRQMQSQRYNLRTGHRVRIYGTRWGDSYRLAADELYGFIQVERVK